MSAYSCALVFNPASSSLVIFGGLWSGLPQSNVFEIQIPTGIVTNRQKLFQLGLEFSTGASLTRDGMVYLTGCSAQRPTKEQSVLSLSLKDLNIEVLR